MIIARSPLRITLGGGGTFGFWRVTSGTLGVALEARHFRRGNLGEALRASYFRRGTLGEAL